MKFLFYIKNFCYIYFPINYKGNRSYYIEIIVRNILSKYKFKKKETL